MEISQIHFGAVAQTARYALSVNDNAREFAAIPLMVDVEPLNLNPHLVVAAGLLWAPHTVIQFGFKDRLSEEVVHRWERELSVKIDAQLTRTAYTRSGNTDLSIVSGTNLSANTPGRDQTSIHVLPSERFYGSMKGVKESIIASNAWIFDNAALAKLCLGILFADEFLARSISVDETLRAEDRDRAIKVLGTLGIKLGDVREASPHV